MSRRPVHSAPVRRPISGADILRGITQAISEKGGAANDGVSPRASPPGVRSLPLRDATTTVEDAVADQITRTAHHKPVPTVTAQGRPIPRSRPVTAGTARVLRPGSASLFRGSADTPAAQQSEAPAGTKRSHHIETRMERIGATADSLFNRQLEQRTTRRTLFSHTMTLPHLGVDLLVEDSKTQYTPQPTRPQSAKATENPTLIAELRASRQQKEDACERLEALGTVPDLVKRREPFLNFLEHNAQRQRHDAVEKMVRTGLATDDDVSMPRSTSFSEQEVAIFQGWQEFVDNSNSAAMDEAGLRELFDAYIERGGHTLNTSTSEKEKSIVGPRVEAVAADVQAPAPSSVLWTAQDTPKMLQHTAEKRQHHSALLAKQKEGIRLAMEIDRLGKSVSTATPSPSPTEPAVTPAMSAEEEKERAEQQQQLARLLSKRKKLQVGGSKRLMLASEARSLEVQRRSHQVLNEVDMQNKSHREVSAARHRSRLENQTRHLQLKKGVRPPNPFHDVTVRGSVVKF